MNVPIIERTIVWLLVALLIFCCGGLGLWGVLKTIETMTLIDRQNSLEASMLELKQRCSEDRSEVVTWMVTTREKIISGEWAEIPTTPRSLMNEER